ncbi:uncharacterized protein LOC143019890 [Oratosquilla oratoria]|uniref:uncharacterized protein LOC143019890 n=1 Tax=Oratosquilla oratoria TaxID=337810 RepID=UPI003F773B89
MKLKTLGGKEKLQKFKDFLTNETYTASMQLSKRSSNPTDHQALKCIKPGKAPGPDNIPLKLLTHGGPELKNRLMLLILKIWETKTLPSDFRDANINTIFKKGNRENYNNYRGILLLSITSKIFARILLDPLLILTEDVLPESQCGLKPSRGTIDMIFCARQLQDKSH